MIGYRTAKILDVTHLVGDAANLNANVLNLVQEEFMRMGTGGEPDAILITEEQSSAIAQKFTDWDEGGGRINRLYGYPVWIVGR